MILTTAPPPPDTDRVWVLGRGIGEVCHCEEQTKSATSQSQNLQNFTIMRLPRHSVKEQTAFTNTVPCNDVHVNHLLTYLPTNLLTSGKTKTKAAFTLAEVLITLTIIGIVAALTMPSLIAKYQEKQTITALKKSYSSLSQAYLMISEENGDPTNWGISKNRDEDRNPTPEGSINLANLFAKHLKVVKNCSNNEGCWHKGVSYKLNGETYANTDERLDMAKIRLVDGTSMAFGGLSSTCEENYGTSKELSSTCAWIVVDINGDQKPNTYGRDIFEFAVTKYSIVPYGTEAQNDYPFSTACKDSSNASGNGCAAWVIYNENLDYLHCDDLSWNGKTKCK